MKGPVVDLEHAKLSDPVSKSIQRILEEQERMRERKKLEEKLEK